MILQQIRKQLDRVLGDYKHARRVAKEEKVNLTKVEQQTADIQEAQKFLQEIAKLTQERAHRQIASVVSRCLQVVFGEDAYEFHIQFEEKRGKTEARLQFKRDELVLENPLREAGGGQCDIACFGLRLACLKLKMPRLRGFLVADESWKNVNGEVYQNRVGELLTMLAKEMNVQFLLSTDDEWLKIGKVVEL